MYKTYITLHFIKQLIHSTLIALDDMHKSGLSYGQITMNSVWVTHSGSIVLRNNSSVWLDNQISDMHMDISAMRMMIIRSICSAVFEREKPQFDDLLAKDDWVQQVQSIFTNSKLYSFLSICKSSKSTTDLLKHPLFDEEILINPMNDWVNLLSAISSFSTSSITNIPNCINKKNEEKENYEKETEDNKYSNEITFKCKCNDATKMLSINFSYNPESEEPEEVIRTLDSMLKDTGYYKYDEDIGRLKCMLVEIKDAFNSTNKNTIKEDQKDNREGNREEKNENNDKDENRDENLITFYRANNRTETENENNMLIDEEISEILHEEGVSSGKEDTYRSLICNK